MTSEKSAGKIYRNGPRKQSCLNEEFLNYLKCNEKAILEAGLNYNWVSEWMLICFSHIQLFATLWIVAHQAPMSTRLLCPCDSPGQNIVVGCHFLLQGIFSIQGSKPSLMFPALAGGFFTTSRTWEGSLVNGYLVNFDVFLSRARLWSHDRAWTEASTGQATWRRKNTVVHYCHIVEEEGLLVDLVFGFLGWF